MSFAFEYNQHIGQRHLIRNTRRHRLWGTRRSITWYDSIDFTEGAHIKNVSNRAELYELQNLLGNEIEDEQPLIDYDMVCWPRRHRKIYTDVFLAKIRKEFL